MYDGTNTSISVQQFWPDQNCFNFGSAFVRTKIDEKLISVIPLICTNLHTQKKVLVQKNRKPQPVAIFNDKSESIPSTYPPKIIQDYGSKKSAQLTKQRAHSVGRSIFSLSLFFCSTCKDFSD